jgi:hypothetical protein
MDPLDCYAKLKQLKGKHPGLKLTNLFNTALSLTSRGSFADVPRGVSEPSSHIGTLHSK